MNYYDRVVYQFINLCTQYFRLKVSYLLVLLRITQMMKIFSYTFYRVSDYFYSREDRTSFQEVVQENRAVPLL